MTTPACGTGPGYRGGCRCEDCRRWNRELQRQWRRRNREAGRTPAKHGPGGFSNYGCHCAACLAPQRDKQSRYTTQKSRNRDPDKHNRVNRAHMQRVQSETGDRARRHRYQWTGPELEVIARTDLTVREQALLLGRTYKAVRNKRSQLTAGEPIPTRLAGQRSRLR